MKPGRTRDDDALRRGLERWVAQHWPDRHGARVDEFVRPRAGWSNETLIVRFVFAGASERVVVRLPPLAASFPSDELDPQAAVLRALVEAGVAVPQVVAVERDLQYLGAPFLVMSFVEGAPGPEVPALDAALAALPVDAQRAVQARFLQTLVSVHRVDWRATHLEAVLRDGVPNELDYWDEYLTWAASPDEPARDLRRALGWCRRNAPAATHDASLLWGDPRLGNVVFAPGGDVSGLLDWELASIGPAEMDLGWYLVLDEMTNHFVGKTVPGFFSHDDAVACYETALGRPVEHLAWHEIFALVRSIAITDRQARLAAAIGARYPGVAGDGNPLLERLNDRIAAFAG